MNTLHLKYAIEVEKTGSISKAAENLYMNQPQLSKAIRELEESVGISIFKRSSKGVVPTTKGAEFIMDAKGIIAQMERLEATYNPKKSGAITLDAAVYRCEYISSAFSRFLMRMRDEKKGKITYRETNTTRAIKNVATGENNIGIIKCNADYEQYFLQMLEERELRYEVLWEYDEMVLIAADNPLAKEEVITEDELEDMTELLFGDNLIYYGRSARSVKTAHENEKVRHMFIYERAGMCDALRSGENLYARITPPPYGYYNKEEFAVLPIRGESTRYHDILFYRKDYKKSASDELFIEAVKEIISEL